MGNMQGFDANEVEPRMGFEVIPAGEYVAIISDSEVKATKKGDGGYLQLTIQVVDGPHEGRFFWERLNMDNPSEKAVAIAKARASAICRAVGVMAPGDSVNLHDIPFKIEVGIKKNKESGEMENVIKNYSPCGTLAKAKAGIATVPKAVAAATQPVSETTAPATATATVATTPVAGGTPPWTTKTFRANAKT